jgi:5'-3' exonuclease
VYSGLADGRGVEQTAGVTDEGSPPVEVYLVDGTYELFRHFYGQPSRLGSSGREVGAVRGVLLTVLGMIESGVTHIGVATDHVITSFRNELWPGYKTGDGVDPVLLAQFEPLEDALRALGVVVWPMVELEADDALASAAALAGSAAGVARVIICTPDKDLSQCVVGERIVQLDRRSGEERDEAGVVERFGVEPASIPDWLALVGDSADGFPGLPGWGARSAATVLAHYGTIDNVPDEPASWDPALRKTVRGADRLIATLRDNRQLVDLFRTLATLRADEPVIGDVADLCWRGPEDTFAAVGEEFRDRRIVERAELLARRSA